MSNTAVGATPTSELEKMAACSVCRLCSRESIVAFFWWSSQRTHKSALLVTTRRWQKVSNKNTALIGNKLQIKALL